MPGFPKQRSVAVLWSLGWCVGLFVASPAAVGQLRVVTYNTNNYNPSQSLPRPGMGTVLEALGDQAKPGFARPIDILLLQEQSTLISSTAGFVDLLNGIYGAGTYARGSLQGATTGAGRPAVVYNTKTVQLLAETQATAASTSGGPRATLRYQFRPVGYDSAADFYVYNSHFKAVDDSASAERRRIQAAEIRGNADALGEGVLAIYAGDLNLYEANEAAFQTLVGPGPGRAFDPVNRVGAWSDSSSFRDVHTQSPVTTSTFTGQVTGGLDDRFDFQLVTSALLDGRGFDSISGSYWAFGNTGTHSLNGPLSSGSVSALQARLPGYSVQNTTAVIDALMGVSDHLPVVADYRLPAKLGVVVPSLPSAVLRGAVTGGSLAVSNAAPVAVAAGADSLVYEITGSGAVTATGSGTRSPLAAAAVHPLAFDTSFAGLRAGSLTVTTSSPQAAAARFSASYSIDVLDRAAVSGGSNGGGSPPTIGAGGSVTVANAAAVPGTRRAAAAIASRSIVGDAGWSLRGLDVGSRFEAGGAVSGTVDFDPAGRLNGPARATLTLGLEHADQTLPGAGPADLGASGWQLATVVTGRTGAGSAVVAAGESFAGLGLGSATLGGGTATIEAGEATASRTVTMQFSPPPTEGLFVSDVLALTGTGGDAVVLSLSYAETSLGTQSERRFGLGWFDTRPGSATSATWIPAVAGNAGSVVTLAEPFAGSWASYSQQLGVSAASDAIGAWGIDVSANLVWAVIDHESEFAVVPMTSPRKTGDANLDGQVDVFDLVLVNGGGKFGTGVASVWAEGDFNDDGVTNVFDLVAVNTAGFYGQGRGAFGAGFAELPTAAAVPEPAMLAAVAALAAGAIRHFRRGGAA